MYVGEGRVGGDGGVSEWVCGCVNKVCMKITGCGGECVGIGMCVFGGVNGWVSKFWSSGIIHMLKSMNTVCITKFAKKWTG